MASARRFPIAFSVILSLFSGSVLAAPTVSWGVAAESAAANIPLGGVASLLMIVALFISGRYVFPHLKSNRLKSFFITALLGAMFAMSSAGHFLSDIEAGVTSTLAISTPQGTKTLGTPFDRTKFDTTIRNDYLQTVLLKFTPDHCVLEGTCSDGALPTGNSCLATFDCRCTTINFDSSPIPKPVASDVAAASDDLLTRFKKNGFDNAALSTKANQELNALLVAKYGTNNSVDPGDYGSVIEYWLSNPTDPVLQGDGGFGHAALTLLYLEELRLGGASNAAIQTEADKQVARWYTREAQARCNNGTIEHWLDPQAWSEDSRLDYWTPRKFVEWYIINRLQRFRVTLTDSQTFSNRHSPAFSLPRDNGLL